MNNREPHISASLPLARSAVSCNKCFTNGAVLRAGIALPQPFTVGRSYKPGGILVVGINPGASKDCGYKEARRTALEQFAKGDDEALLAYWGSLASDAKAVWNPRYLDRLDRLSLALEDISVGNLALCATEGNNYPGWLLSTCWNNHSSQMLATLQPSVVILMGSESVMGRFTAAVREMRPLCNVIRMAHFAHREGHAYEHTECARVKAAMASAGNAA